MTSFAPFLRLPLELRLEILRLVRFDPREDDTVFTHHYNRDRSAVLFWRERRLSCVCRRFRFESVNTNKVDE